MIDPAIKAAMADVERAIEELDPGPAQSTALASEFLSYAQMVRRWRAELAMQHFFKVIE